MLDISTDFTTVADAQETIVYRTRGATTGVTIPHALRRATTTREAEPSGGACRAADVVWHLSSGELTAPEVGGAIVDATGTIWTILSVAAETLASRWRCACRNLALSAGLDERIVIQRATWTKGDTGAPLAVWRDERANVPARIQPLEEQVQLDHDRRGARATHKVYLIEPIACDDSTRIVHAGVIYRLVKLEQAERIDAPAVLLVEQAR